MPFRASGIEQTYQLSQLLIDWPIPMRARAGTIPPETFRDGVVVVAIIQALIQMQIKRHYQFIICPPLPQPAIHAHTTAPFRFSITPPRAVSQQHPRAVTLPLAARRETRVVCTGKRAGAVVWHSPAQTGRSIRVAAPRVGERRPEENWGGSRLCCPSGRSVKRSWSDWPQGAGSEGRLEPSRGRGTDVRKAD
jgi:hypothetical protein